MRFKLFEKAINLAVEKNDAYRIRIAEEGSEIKQYLSMYKYFNVDFFDFSTSGGKEALQNWSYKKTKEVFNMIDSDLYYFAIFKISENEYGLYTKMHHIISDAWGTVTQISKIIESYSKFKNNLEIEEANEPSYIEYIECEKEYINSNKYEKDKAFWNEKFNTVPEFMNFKPSGIVYKNTKGARKTFVLSRELTSKINEFCTYNRCSPFIIFFSVLYMYISRTTSKSDIVLGTPILGRSNAREKKTVGMFINIMPMRINVDLKQDFISFIKSLAKQWSTAIRYQRYSYTLIQDDFRNMHNINGNLIDVVLSFQNAKIDKSEITGEYSLIWQENGYQANSLQIHISDRECEDEYIIDFDYLVDVFDTEEND